MTVSVENIRIRCIVGILPDERMRRQPVVVSVSLEYDDDAPGEPVRPGDPTPAVDYREVDREVRRIVLEGEFGLLEDLVQGVASALAGRFGRASTVAVEAQKPRALGRRARAKVRYLHRNPPRSRA